ncbi:polysaccharide biosynthesis C-terminal domain-containing protein [Paenibacillus sp. FSL P2-0089]|uniref:lipopolysaccharide biosynthesis protein n=1 Tax=Paenibacillus sp. FSL P2-0089 TaxID=2954526 RepID=UPI00315A12ED
MVYLISKLKSLIRKTNENNRTILFNTLGAFLVKGGALIISLFTLPAYINYFENQRILGLWFTMLSVLSWILTFDLGIGNGLRNHLVPVITNKNDLMAKKYISSAYLVISAVVLVTVGFSMIVFKWISWNSIFNIPNSIVSEKALYITVCIIFSGIMFQFLLKLISSILYAMQKSALINLLSLLTSIITLTYVSLAKTSDITSNLISMAIVNVLAVNIPLIVVSLIVFYKKLPKCRPNIRFFDRKYANDIMKLGGAFFWVQIMYMIITTTNEFLITWFTGPDRVVEYQIYNKLFTLIGMVFTLALTPIWSAVTKAFAEQRYEWIIKLYKILRILALVAVLCEFGMILILQFGVDIWLGDNTIKVNYFYAVIFALSGSIFIWNGVLSSIANGLGQLKAQTIFFTIGAIIKIPIAWILVMVCDSWIGIVIANIIAMGLYCIVQPISLNKFLKKRDSGVDKYVYK